MSSENSASQTVAQPFAVQSDSAKRPFRARTGFLHTVSDKELPAGYTNIQLHGTTSPVHCETARDTRRDANLYMTNEHDISLSAHISLGHRGNLNIAD